MRSSGLLHPELAAIVAGMGHTQMLCLADAGLPVPTGVHRVQLGVSRGVPGLLDVLDAVLGDLVVEAATIADELDDPDLAPAIRDRLAAVELTTCSHEELKAATASCVAVAVTGEHTPYANVLLRAGVPFG